MGLLVFASVALASEPTPKESPLLQKPWYELRSDNFRTFSCAQTQEVAKLVARLEYFRSTYSTLAGTQAVASIPINVMVFADQPTMRPYLPLYEGSPANLRALFIRASDENWIVTCLSGDTRASFETVYHEYAHLLLRRNDRIWPLWLKEGMAEIYATFQLVGLRGHIGSAKTGYLVLLRREGLMSLEELMAVTHESPAYNERQRQGQFYAQSWLLAHYLVVGDNPVLRSRFAGYTTRLKQGEGPLEALTNALGVTSAALQAGLQKYLMRPTLDDIPLVLSSEVSAPDRSQARPLSKAEIAVRLGNELIRVRLPEKAQEYFLYAKELAPASPLPFEGLGLAATSRKDWGEARQYLERAMQLKSDAFLTYFLYAAARLSQATAGQNPPPPMDPGSAAEIRRALARSTQLMPTFGPSYYMLGVFDANQGDMRDAEQHLRKALELEPDNSACAIVLARILMARADRAGARQTLLPVLHPSVDENTRNAAQELLRRISQENPKAWAVPRRTAVKKSPVQRSLPPYVLWTLVGTVVLGSVFLLRRGFQR